MDIQKILNEKDHKVFLFILKKSLYIREWIGKTDEDFGYGVLRVTYARCPMETDLVYLRGQYNF